MLRIALTAPWAGVIGSVLGVAVLALQSHPGSAAEAHMLLSVGVVVGLIVSMMVTVPACILLGTPLIYALRRQLRGAPWRWSLVVTVLGMMIGAVLFGVLAAGSSGRGGIGMALLFSGTSSLSFGLLYGLPARRSLETNS